MAIYCGQTCETCQINKVNQNSLHKAYLQRHWNTTGKDSQNHNLPTKSSFSFSLMKYENAPVTRKRFPKVPQHIKPNLWKQTKKKLGWKLQLISLASCTMPQVHLQHVCDLSLSWQLHWPTLVKGTGCTVLRHSVRYNDAKSKWGLTLLFPLQS